MEYISKEFTFNFFKLLSNIDKVEDKSTLLNIVKLLRLIINSSYDEIYVADSSGNTIFANVACERFYGISLENIIMENVNNLVKKGVYYPSVTNMVLEAKRKVTILQNTQEGHTQIVTGTPVFNNNNEIIFVVGNSRNLTELFNPLDTYEEIKKAKPNIVESGSQKNNVVHFGAIYTKNPSMKNIIIKLKKVAKTDSTILLLGATGVGKDFLVKEIHKYSSWANGPLVNVNCGAIPSSIIESELFGHEEGSFTGSRKGGKTGLIEAANGGTLFLNEISETPFYLQVKLLQVLQDKQIFKVGGNKPIKINTRVIAATNRDLLEMVENGSFREDLYYRLCVFPIEILPLRERKEDIIDLANHFLEKYNNKYNENKYFSKDALALFLTYSWPGNIRQLENIIETIIVSEQRDLIELNSMPELVRSSVKYPDLSSMNNLVKMVDDMKKNIIQESYNKLGSSYKVAKDLGISQRTALRYINRYVKNT